MAPLSQMVAIAVRHARLEGGRDLEALLGTIGADPVYDSHSVGRRLRGPRNTLRYYEHIMAQVQPEGDAAPTTHQAPAIPTFGVAGLSGERMYADDRFLRTLTGPLRDQLGPIPPRALGPAA